MFPLVKVGQVDLAVGIYVFSSLDHHSASGLDKANGRVVGIRVQEPKTHWDVVDIACQIGEKQCNIYHLKKNNTGNRRNRKK